MYLLFFIFLFFFGLAVGSFLNAVIWRLEAGESIIAELRPEGEVSLPYGASGTNTRNYAKRVARSHCPQCKTTLHWYDLVPVFSFIWLRGKCRYCGEKISWQYPAVEIATALIFLLITNTQYPISNVADTRELFLWILDIGYWIFIASSLIIIFVYDLKHYIIPDKILFSAIGITLIYRVLGSLDFGDSNLFRIYDLGFRIYELNILYLAAGVGAMTFFLALVLISRGKWMGLGDVKLAFLMGLVLGWPNILVALFLAFMSGAMVGLSLILISSHRKTAGLAMTKNYSLKSQIPFGPFLIAGTFAALFWGNYLVEWYWGLLF